MAGLLGGGLEWKFAAHWSGKVEYDYVKFDTATFSINEINDVGVMSTPIRSATSSLNMLKAGVAYHFRLAVTGLVARPQRLCSQDDKRRVPATSARA